MLQINEIFGPTIQGEGAAAGQHCLFVRVALCNLTCTWCDTAYTWAHTPALAAKTASGIVHDKAANIKKMTTDEVVNELYKLWPIRTAPTRIIISGGEPVMQNVALTPFVEQVTDYGNQVHVETAGTIIPSAAFDDAVAQYNVSPKLEHSGNRTNMRFKPVVLKWFANNEKAYFKFVVRGVQDLDEVQRMVMLAEIDPSRVQVMPEGVTTDTTMAIAKEIVGPATKLGYGLSLRQHILLWSDVRGK